MAWTAPRTWVAAETLTAALMNEQLRDNLNAAFPVGSIHYFMQAATTTETTINGFALECNAVSVLRATYPNLNTLLSGLSYPFGTADGTHMTLPDMFGRSLHAMSASGHADVNAIGDSDGVTKASRTPKNAAHAHSLSVTGSTGTGSTGTGTTGASGSDLAADGSNKPVGPAGHTHSVPALSIPSLSVSASGSSGGGGAYSGAYLVAGIHGVKY